LEDGTARHDYAPGVAVAAHDQAVVRTENPRVVEALFLEGEALLGGHDLALRFDDSGVGALQVGFGHLQLLGGFIEIRRRSDSVGNQLGEAFVVEPGPLFDRLRAGFVHGYPLRRGAGCRERSGSDFDLPGQFAVVEAREQLAGFNRVVLVHEDFGQALLEAGAEGGFGAGLQRAGAHHLGGDGGGLDLVSRHRHWRELGAVGDADGKQRGRQDPEGYPGAAVLEERNQFHVLPWHARLPAGTAAARGARGDGLRPLENFSSRARTSRPTA